MTTSRIVSMPGPSRINYGVQIPEDAKVTLKPLYWFILKNGGRKGYIADRGEFGFQLVMDNGRGLTGEIFTSGEQAIKVLKLKDRKCECVVGVWQIFLADIGVGVVEQNYGYPGKEPLFKGWQVSAATQKRYFDTLEDAKWWLGID